MALVGIFARPHGLRGQVVINVETDFPDDRFKPGASVFVERDGRVERRVVGSVRFHKGRPIVAFEGVDSIEAAEELAGRELRVPRDELAALPPGTFYRHDLIGCRVERVSGEPVGDVEDVEGSIGGSRLVVRGRRGAVLIPLAAAICTTIDPAARRIVVDPPEGLLELNEDGS